MTRSPHTKLAERINAALSLLKEGSGTEEVISEIITRFGVSRRQAYRYIQQAQQIESKLPIPEGKVVFTVKLPKSLVCLLRECANFTGESLSSIVAQAIEAYLKRRG